MTQVAALRNLIAALELPFVDSPAFPPMSERAERRAMTALLMAFALLVQALIPGLAVAAPTAHEGGMICTEMGLQNAPAGSIPDHLPVAPNCQHCLCPASHAAPTPPVDVLSVAYVVVDGTIVPPTRGNLPIVRAPPRPPGQGPPSARA